MGGAVLLLLGSIVPNRRGACHLAFWSFFVSELSINCTDCMH